MNYPAASYGVSTARAKSLRRKRRGIRPKEIEDEIAVPGHESVSGEAVQKICYACKPNSFHIRADGSVGKCTVAVDKDYNHIGNLDGSGKIRIDPQKMSRWTRGMISLDRQELECPLSKLDSQPFPSDGFS